MSYWWLSFVDRVDDAALHLGCAIVYGENSADAVRTAWRLGCNPGGEVWGIALPRDKAIHHSLIGRLLTDGDLIEAEFYIADPLAGRS